MGELFIILMILATAFALIQAIRIKDRFARIINAVIAIAAGASITPIPQISIDGYYLFMIACFLVVLYAFSDNSFDLHKKSVLVGTGGIQLVSHLFLYQQWQGWEIFCYASILTVVVYIFVVTKYIREYQFEMGFLTVLMVDALIKSMVVLSGAETFSPGS